MLGVSEKSLYTWEKAGKIPAPGRNYRGWRAYSPEQVAAIRAYLEAGPTEPTGASTTAETRRLTGLTARNQLTGTVTAVRADGVLSEVTLRLGDGQEIVSVVTTASVRRLGLAVGMEATAVIKATEVMLFR